MHRELTLVFVLFRSRALVSVVRRRIDIETSGNFFAVLANYKRVKALSSDTGSVWKSELEGNYLVIMSADHYGQISYDGDPTMDDDEHRHTHFLDLTNGEGGDHVTMYYEDEDDEDERI